MAEFRKEEQKSATCLPLATESLWGSSSSLSSDHTV